MKTISTKELEVVQDLWSQVFQIERFFKDVDLTGGTYVAPVRVKNEGDHVTVSFSIRDVGKEALKVTYSNGVLLVVGKATQNENGEEVGEIIRSIPIGEGFDGEKAEFEYEKGNVKITMPREGSESSLFPEMDFETGFFA